MVDIFASQYGWAKDDIYFNLYPDEVIILSEKIQSRKSLDYLMLLNIAHNPHLHKKDASKLFDALKNTLPARPPQELDRATFDLLKKRIAANSQSRIVVK